jgi:hypothetical protein
MPTGAAIGGATLGGAYLSSKAAGKAADASQAGAEASAGVQRYMYDTSRKDLAPWRNVGVGALGKLAKLYGISSTPALTAPDYSQENFDAQKYLQDNPDVARAYVDPWWHWQNAGQYENRTFPAITQPAKEGEYIPKDQPDYSEFYNSPDYQFTFGEGQRAVNAGLAARGLSNSGRAMKELTRYGQGAASTQLNNYRNALASLAGIGQTATNTTAAAGSNAAAGIGQAYQNAADARASGYLGTANAFNNALNQGTGLYALSKLYSKAA